MLRKLSVLIAVGAAVAFVAQGSALAGAGVIGALGVLIVLVWLVRRRPQLIEDWHDAEIAAAQWLRSRGCGSVELTTSGADGGVDVVTSAWAVQVKHRSKPTGRPAVQQIVGAALDVDREPAVISTSGFTAPAIAYADDHGVALVELGLDGQGRPVNAHALQLGQRSGLLGRITRR